jgi:hypothetical protein
MKRNLFVLFCLFLVLPAGSIWAGQVSFSTSYPTPTAAYNKVSLPSGAQGNNPCGGVGNPQNKGMLFLAANGSLNVCDNNGNAQVYPQQCYNSFCTYATANTCPPVPLIGTCSPTCASGFTNSVGVPDTIQTDSTDCVVSIVCCGGN